MYDLEIVMDDRPGELARMGEILGRAGISVEGGGVFVVGGRGVAHFLFRDGLAARDALAQGGITVASCREVLLLRLDQEEPGQLGKIARAMADVGVNIEVQYSDHDHRLEDTRTNEAPDRDHFLAGRRAACPLLASLRRTARTRPDRSGRLGLDRPLGTHDARGTAAVPGWDPFHEIGLQPVMEVMMVERDLRAVAADR